MEEPAKREPRDVDMRNATVALERAARHARELAQRTGTPCWIMRDGKIVDAISGREAVLPATVVSDETNQGKKT